MFGVPRSVDIDQVFVSFVGDDDEIALAGEGGNFLSFGAGENDAGGILRRVVVDGAGILRGVIFESLAQAGFPRGCGGNEQRACLGAGDEVADRRPVRGEDEDVVASIEDALEGGVEGVSAAGGDEDVFFLAADFVALLEFGGESGTQRLDSGAGRVAGVIRGERVGHGLLDGLGRVKKRLATVQAPDGVSGFAEGEDFVADLNNVREADFIEPVSELRRRAICHVGTPNSPAYRSARSAAKLAGSLGGMNAGVWRRIANSGYII